MSTRDLASVAVKVIGLYFGITSVEQVAYFGATMAVTQTVGLEQIALAFVSGATFYLFCRRTDLCLQIAGIPLPESGPSTEQT